jgi:plastocyanin
MRKLNGLILLSALIMAYSTASAQQMVIKIDDQPIPSGVVDSITIDPLLNEVNITTTPNYVVNYETVGDDVVITSFTASSASVVAGDTVTFSWQTSNADSCDATGGVDGWAATNLPVNGSRQITTATIGQHSYTLTCSGLNGPATLSIQVDTTSADALAITSFTATPDAIMAGESTTISWNTTNAQSCTPTGGTADWTSQTITLPSGSANITIDSTGDYTFSLVCQGLIGDQQSRSDTVTVSPVGVSCDDVSLAGNINDWGSFWSANFPGPSYQNVTNRIIPQKGYLALEFNTANIIDDGKISALENSSTPGIRTGSISQCPGDFNVAPECNYTWGLGGGIRWATNGKFGACDLDANTTYYFNITFTDGEDPDTSTCNEAPCRINLQHVNL